MAFDPKVAAGGVAVVAIGGGAGVAIHKGTSGSSVEEKSKIEEAIEKAGFKIENKTDVCKAKLEKDWGEDNYKDAVVTCVENKTFKQRATDLGLNPLNADEIKDNEGPWKIKWDNKKETVKILKIKDSSTAWTKISEAKEEIKDFCEVQNKFTKETKTSEWHKYLKICVEEDGTEPNNKKLSAALEKDFWYNEETIETTMKKASFEKKTNVSSVVGCSEDALNLPYSEVEYKKVIATCTNSTNFVARAEKLKLDVLKSTDQNGWDTYWNTKSNEEKTEIKTIVGAQSTSENDWSNVKTAINGYCTGTNKGNKTISETTKDEDWKKFLKACTKHKDSESATAAERASLLTKDFWTGK